MEKKVFVEKVVFTLGEGKTMDVEVKRNSITLINSNQTYKPINIDPETLIISIGEIRSWWFSFAEVGVIGGVGTLKLSQSSFRFDYWGINGITLKDLEEIYQAYVDLTVGTNSIEEESVPVSGDIHE
jgi:hypothetical protein